MNHQSLRMFFLLKCEAKVYYSSKGNNQYTLSPYKIPRDSCCNHLETAMWRSIEKDLRKSSDIPDRVEKEPWCYSGKKVDVDIRNLIIIRQSISRAHTLYDNSCWIPQLSRNIWAPEHTDWSFWCMRKNQQRS